MPTIIPTATGFISTSATVLVAETVTVTSTATSLPTDAVFAFVLQNNSNKTILVGDSVSQPYQLAKGAPMTFELDNPNQVWVKVDSGTAPLTILKLK